MKIYFSQADKRWANKMYSIKNDKSQTMKSSGCCPTSCAMIVHNLTNNKILPPEIADLFVRKRFRTSNDGTSTSALPFVANYYDLKYKLSYKIEDAIKCLTDGGMVVARCTNGLFTSSGHYIVIADYINNELLVYDPYMYVGKMNTTYRKGKTRVEGNYIYVGKQNMQKYGAVREYYCFNSKKTRGDIMLDKLIEQFGEEAVKKSLETLIKTVNDDGVASSWAVEELEEAKKKGITDGKNPEMFATREQVAVMINRAIKE